jgi:TRAP-type uncharacterized transport system fused permease subunit
LIVYNVLTATAAVVMISGANAGYFFGPIGWRLRILLMAAGLLLFVPGWVTDLTGVGFFTVVLVSQYRQRHRMLVSEGETLP